MKYDTKNFMITYLTPDAEVAANNYTLQERMNSVAHSINAYVNDWSANRRDLELEWIECWAEYLSNHRAAEELRHSALAVTGETMASTKSWRHKITTGKAFELVETVNSYLQGAFFPNRQWFDLHPKEVMADEQWEDTLFVLTNYLLQKFDEARFKSYWETFCRQILITGNSVLALPWRYEAINTWKNQPVKKGKQTKFVPTEVQKVIQNGFDFQVVDMFDFYFDPAEPDTRKSNCIRRIIKRKGDIIRLIEQGVYPLIDKQDIINVPAYSPSSMSSTHKERLTYMSGLETMYQINQEQVALYEFWGNLQVGDYEFVDVCATICGDKLASIMPNPFWGGRPFISGSLVDVHNSPYGLGLLQPVLGQLHGMFEIQNHRLDVDELTINPTLLVTNDGSLDPNSFFVEPGKVIFVEDPETTVKPVEIQNTTQVSVQDEGLLEQRIDKTTGVGSYVGVNGGRNAERVTAEEVIAQRDAGGNRLGNYYAHIEENSLKDFLTKAYSYLQQFVITDEVVRIKRNVQDSFKQQYDYFKVGQEELQNEVDIVPVGSDFLVNKEYELKQRLDFYTFTTSNPELAKYINWKEAIKDLARRFLKQDWSDFVMMPDEQPAPVPGELAAEADLMQAQSGMMPPQEGMMPPPGATQPVEGGVPPTGNADNDAFFNEMANNPNLAMSVIDQGMQQE